MFFIYFAFYVTGLNFVRPSITIPILYALLPPKTALTYKTKTSKLKSIDMKKF